MNGFLRKGDFWSGLALAGFGSFVVAQTRHWDYMGDDGPGAGFFPMWDGSAMIVLSLLLVAGAVLKPGAPGATPLWSDLRRALLCWLAFVACIALLKPLGFMLAFALLTWFIVALMYGQPQRIALPLALGGAVLFQALFGWALDIQLPAGVLAGLLAR